MMQAGDNTFVRELRVERIIIERNGKVMMEIGSDENGGNIVIYSSSQVPAIEIRVSKDNGLIEVIAEMGNTAVEISADDNSNGYILLSDATGKPKFGMGVSREGVWDVLILDEALKKRKDIVNR